jgi:hypothetical protein
MKEGSASAHAVEQACVSTARKGRIAESAVADDSVNTVRERTIAMSVKGLAFVSMGDEKRIAKC